MEKITTTAAGASSAAFFSMIGNPLRFRFFLLQKLPAAFFSGLRLKEASGAQCSVTVPYGWFTRNPFRSTYFASLSMAAEMSTGILAMAGVYGRRPPVSMLVVGIEGKFYKKAVGKTNFVCRQGDLIRQAVETAIGSGAPQTFRALSSGWNAQNELVAEFWITWSFKGKSIVKSQ
jgi:hypothetical protein